VKLILTPLSNIPLIQIGDPLAKIILSSLHENEIRLHDGDIIVIAQKIVSKSEGRMVDLSCINPSSDAIKLATRSEKKPQLVELILRESRSVLRVRPGTIIVEHRLGFICANAGIDHSNVAGNGTETKECVLLLPENPDYSANMIRREMEETTGARLGVLIIDSHGRAWRMGTVGVAIGLSGLPGLVDLRGKPDLYGYTLRITQVGAADELAAAASLIMGQAAEGTPVVHVRGFPYPLQDGELKEIIRPKDQDMFR